MAYISKKDILSSYKELSNLTDDPSSQGATQITSILRFFFALGRFYSVFNRPCNTKNKEDRNKYIAYVGEVVSVNEEMYTANFYLSLKRSPDYNVGSNFFSVNVVKNSLENQERNYDFPQRGNSPLFNVSNGYLIENEKYFQNLNTYLKTPELRRAFTIWLIRNDNIFISGDNVYLSIKSHLSQKYSNPIIDSFIPTEKEFDASLISLEEEPAKISDVDIFRLFNPIVDINPIILYGPPGTGKTHSLQDNYMKHFTEEDRWFTTFHQSFSYEEFVEGLKPELGKSGSDITYKIDKGVFYQACEKAAKLAGFDNLSSTVNSTKEERVGKFKKAIDERKLVLLCIDEINRGNIASIFGDLISLIEPSKRLGNKEELILTLPYSKEKFGVPSNLLIVGTMNTADRSIQLLDSALRRRFQFKELPPDYSVIKNLRAKEILKDINSRVRALKNKDSQIGHSYFYEIPEKTDNESSLILNTLVNKIIPLLEEYFYNDYTKIRFVLSEKDAKPTFFVKDIDATKMYGEFADIADFEETIDFYELNPDLKKALENEDLAKEFLARWNKDEE